MYKSKKIIGIIPARSGSKGLKDKNIKFLNKKPLLVYSIEAAKESGVFDKIIVSTDSEKYAQIARDNLIEVPFLRSQKNSNDEANSWEVVKEVLGNFEEKFDIVVLLQPTSPLRTSEDIKNSLDLFFKKNAQSIVSVKEVSHFPKFINTIKEDLSLDNFVEKKFQNKRRQDFEKFYTPNGAIYIIKTKNLLKSINLYTKNSYAYIMEKENSVDIDDETDFLLAEMILKRRINAK